MVCLEAPQNQECLYTLNIPVEDVDFQVDGVLVSLDQAVVNVGWNEIDAVELVGCIEGGLAQNMVKAVAIAADGTVWAGTANGVSRFNNGFWNSYTMEGGLVNDIVNALGFNHDGSLWIATEAGISKYDGETILPFPARAAAMSRVWLRRSP